jgi:hypothetical protein
MSQVKKNKLLFFSLLLLTGATILAFVFTDRDDHTEVDKNIFKVADLKSVNEVRLLRANDSINLKFNGSSWIVNEKYEADKNMIQVLFATLQQAEAKRILTGAISDSIQNQFRKAGTTVELLIDGTAVKSFQAVGNVSKTTAYFKNMEDDEIYVMAIPGYRVYVAGVLELNENGFRNKYAFGFNWQNFKSLRASFGAQPSENFSVSMNKGYFSIDNLKETDTTKLYNYLDEVARLTVDQFHETATFDTVASKPLVEIVVGDIASRTYQLKIFGSGDSQVMPGLLNGEPVDISAPKIRPLMKGKSFFAKKRQ